MVNPEQFIDTVIDGRYRLTRFIGKGAFGWVFEANQETLGEYVARVAVKIITPEDEQQRISFLREIRGLAQLRHDHILVYLNSGQVENSGSLFLVTELAETSLARAIEPPSRLSEEELRAMALGIASALAYIHSKGTVHRDAKPANILRVEGRWKLADFGLVRAVEKSTSTSSGIIGTPAYMAPEYLRDGVISPAMDVYAFGMTLLKAVTGRHPYEGETAGRIIARIISQAPTLPADLREPWRNIIRRCLEYDPRQRCSAAEITQPLRSSPPPPTPEWEPSVESATPIPPRVEVNVAKPVQTSPPFIAEYPPPHLTTTPATKPKALPIIIGLVILVLIIAGAISLMSRDPKVANLSPSINLTGEWKLVNTIESTSYRPYQGMQLGYRVFLQQNGGKLTGTGEKWWENGREIPSTAHSPITLEGVLSGLTVTATFVEKGARRITSGSFTWRVFSDGRRLEGRFTHTAANSSGTSTADRVR